MDSFEFNKIAGAVLFAILVVFGIGTLADIIYHAPAPERPGFQVAIEDATDTDDEEAAEEVTLAMLLREADPAAGEGRTRACAACHTFDEGGPNRVGPNLYNVVGAPIAGHEGFNYSSALRERAEELETWSYEALDGYIANPRQWAPGTTMTYAGMRDPRQRAELIRYLAEISADPPPLPEVEEEAEAEPAEEEAEVEPAEEEAEVEPAEEEAEAEPAEEAERADADAEPATDEEVVAEEELADTEFAAAFDGATVEKGQSSFRKCAACHTVEEGGPNRVGPNLYGIVGAEIAAVEGYNYSSAMRSKAEEWGQWSLDHLFAFLRDPRATVQGTRMVFPGIRDDEELASLIMYLNSHSDDPVNLPGE